MWEMARQRSDCSLPHRNQRAAASDPTTDHPNGVEVKQPKGPHARDAFRLARQAQTTRTAPASNEVGRGSACCGQPPTLGGLGFSKRASRVAPWGSTRWELPVRRTWYGVNHGRRPSPAKGPVWLPGPRIVQGVRGLGGQPPLAGTRLGWREGSSKVVRPESAYGSRAHPPRSGRSAPGLACTHPGARHNPMPSRGTPTLPEARSLCHVEESRTGGAETPQRSPIGDSAQRRGVRPTAPLGGRHGREPLAVTSVLVRAASTACQPGVFLVAAFTRASSSTGRAADF